MVPVEMQLEIELDRQFLEISDVSREVDPEDLIRAALAFGKGKTWTEILEDPFIVVLGEAGTGKTTEFRRQASNAGGSGERFFVELTALADIGLRASLLPVEAGRLDAWRASDREATFFLDSLDEAKLHRRTLRDALRKLQQELAEQWERVRLVISCRVSDWRETDLAAIKEVLPAELRAGIRVVQIAPLNPEQIAALAAHISVRDVDGFTRAIADSYAQAFVERPLDVAWLGNYWLKHGRFGCLHELMAENIDQKLSERSPDRPSTLSLENKRGGARALAGIATLTHRLSIALPGDPVDVRRAESAINTREVFADWPIPQIEELLRTGLFDESTYGRVRFHHRSVQDFLASRWLHELRQAGLPLEKIRNLFLRDESGEVAIPKELGPVLAWLCLWDPELRVEIIKEAPALLIAHGDPSGFSENERGEILHSYALCYCNRTRLFSDFEIASLERFATPELAGVLKELLAQEDLQEEFAALLFQLVELGRIYSCLEEAICVAVDLGAPERARIAAIRAVAALGGGDEWARLLELVDSAQAWSQDVAGAFVRALYPDVLDVEGLVRVLECCEPKRRNHVTLLQGVLEYDIPRRGGADLRRELLARFLGLVRLEGEDGTVSVASGRTWMLRTLGHLVGAVMEDLPKDAEHPEIVGLVLEFFRWCNEQGMRTWCGVDEVREAIARSPEVRRRLFWKRVEQHRQETGRPPRSRFELRFQHDLFELTWEDASWLATDSTARGDVRERLLAFDALAFLPHSSEVRQELREILQDVARDDVALTKRLERLSARPALQHSEEGRWARQLRAQEIRAQRIREKDLAVLKNEVESISDGSNFNALCFLVRKAQNVQHSRWGEASTDSLRELYGDQIADAAEQGWRKFWRQGNPSLPHERERNTTPWDIIVGLVGLGLDFACGLDISSLNEAEVELATRYAANELNGFPPWFEQLAAHWPERVCEALRPAVNADYLGGEEVHRVLAKLPWSKGPVKAAFAPLVLELLLQVNAPTLKALEEALGVVYGVEGFDPGALDTVIGDSCQRAQDDLARWGLLWVLWGCRDGAAAVDSLEQLLRGLPREQAYVRVLEVCHRIREGYEREQLALCRDLPALKRLVPIVYDFVAPQDDIHHEGVYTPSRRDTAQELRSQLVMGIANLPSPDAVAALREIAENPHLASAREWILHQADARVVANADLSVPDETGFLVSLYREHGIAARQHIVTDLNKTNLVKILFLASNPRVSNLNELALDNEAREIEGKMRASEYRDAFLFKSRWAVRPLDLQQILLEERPTVVHFSGHGGGAVGLVFHSEQDGEAKTVSSETLRDLFCVHGNGVRVVVLNACQSVEQAKVLSDTVDFVVGMKDNIGDEAARVFAAAFYRGLGFGRSVKEAFDQGVLELRLAEYEEDAGLPELFVRPDIPLDKTRLVATGEGR